MNNNDERDYQEEADNARELRAERDSAGAGEYETARADLIAAGVPASDIIRPAIGKWAGGCVVRTVPDSADREGECTVLLHMPDGTWLSPSLDGPGRSDVYGDDPVALLAAHRRVAGD